MGKKFDDTLKFLGSDYIKAHDDIETIIFREYGNYKIEISGLNVPGKYDATIYVWKDNKKFTSIQDIHSKEELLKHLETVLPTLTSSQD